MSEQAPTKDQLSGYDIVRHRIGQLIDRHGSLRNAARVLEISPAYLSRLLRGEKQEPSHEMLRRLRLRRVVSYEALP